MKNVFSHVETEDGETFMGIVEIRETNDGETWHAFVSTDAGLLVLGASNVRSILPVGDPS